MPNPATLARAIMRSLDGESDTETVHALVADLRVLANTVIDLTAKVERVEALAANLDNAALWAINHPDVDDDLKAHAHADRGLAAQIRAILNGETA